MIWPPNEDRWGDVGTAEGKLVGAFEGKIDGAGVGTVRANS